MTLKELMMQYLKEEGYLPQETEFGLDFKCEGRSYVFFYDADDDQYFRLMMPNIYDVTDENRDAVLVALNKTNTTVKVVKAYTPIPQAVWIGFEVLVDSTPVLSDFIPRAISMLRTAQQTFYEALQEG